MKLVLKNTGGIAQKRLHIVKNDLPCLDTVWHYHPEFELLYISQSSGSRFVGDNVASFSPGELVLVGPYLPHLWRNDTKYYEDGNYGKVQTIVLKFLRNFIGENTFDNPGFSAISQMLNRAKFGLCFNKEVSKEFHDDLIQIVDLTPTEQAIQLLHLLHRLSLKKDYTILSSTDMRQFTFEHSQRLDKVIKFISDNYAEPISLQDVSEIACMTTNSFCRFFKKKMNKPYTQFLNEVRIRNASRLLMQQDLPVMEICYKVGYSSITNFNKKFKEIMGCTPKKYRQSLYR